MAWIDDRVWCHPKVVLLSDAAFRGWVNGCAYSAGFGLRGRLERDHQKLLGISQKSRKELLEVGLWHESAGGTVVIHDWDEHNGRRDDRRERDRQRKRAERLRAKEVGQSIGASLGTSAGQSGGASKGTARGEGSEGSEGSEEDLTQPRKVELRTQPFNPKGPAPPKQPRLQRLLAATGLAGIEAAEAEIKLFRALNHATEADVTAAIEAARAPNAKDRLAVALAVLKKRKAVA